MAAEDGTEGMDRLARAFEVMSSTSALDLLSRYEGHWQRVHQRALYRLLELRRARHSKSTNEPGKWMKYKGRGARIRNGLSLLEAFGPLPTLVPHRAVPSSAPPESPGDGTAGSRL